MRPTKLNGKRILFFTAGLLCFLYAFNRLFVWNYEQGRQQVSSNFNVVSKQDKNEQTQTASISAVKAEQHQQENSFNAWFEKWSPLFAKLTKTLDDNGVGIEGHILTELDGGFNRIPQVKAYYNHVMSRRSEIRRICETGFNGGHSTMMWASMFNGDITIVAFDLCLKDRCAIGEREIRNIFPNLDLTLVRGDSTTTVPAYAKAHTDVKCDLISVDGGHSGPVPKLDISNFLPMATEKSTLVLDDVNPNSKEGYVKNVGVAWNHAVSVKWVIPLQECEYCFNERYHSRYDHKFCIARYNPK